MEDQTEIDMKLEDDYWNVDFLVKPDSYGSGPRVKVSPEFLERYGRIWKEFENLQNELADLREKFRK